MKLRFNSTKTRRIRSAMNCSIEQLESRTLLTSVVVNTVQDGLHARGSAVVSLRDAIQIADRSASPTTITFAPQVFSVARTIALDGKTLTLNNTAHPTEIEGPTTGVTVSGAGRSGVFDVQLATVTFSHVNVTGGTNSGIYNSGNLTFSDGTISGNASAYSGGGIYCTGYTSLHLSNVTVANNRSASDGGGGGIWCDSAATLDNVAVIGNTNAGADGGGIYVAGGPLTVTNSTIANNTTSGGGGGIYTGLTATETLTNVTIANNVSGYGYGGGGIANDGSTRLTNVTIAGNTGFNGTGITNGSNPSKDFVIANSIVAGNLPVSNGPPDDAYGAFDSLGDNLIGDVGSNSFGWTAADYTGTNATPLNPDLSPLASNGGYAQTLLPKAGSLAIDHGSNALLPAGLAVDERGLRRVVNGVVDIGAVEVQTIVQPKMPVAPTDLKAVLGSSDTVTLTWKDNSDVDSGYNIARSFDGVNWTRIATVAGNASTYTQGGLPASSHISFKVRGFIGNVFSDYTNTVQVTTLAAIPDPIGREYAATTGETDAYGTNVQAILGQPTSSEQDVPGVAGAQEMRFQGGTIYWSPTTGAHVVYGAIGGEYAATDQETDAGGNNVQALIGLPTGDEQNVPGVAGARETTFQNGTIYWSPATGAHVVYGAIGGEYAATAQETDAGGNNVQILIGLPTGDEQNVPGVAGARETPFQNGTIYWSPATGAHVVYGAIDGLYSSLGGPAVIGLPLGDEAAILGGRIAYFANGSIVWTPEAGAHFQPN